MGKKTGNCFVTYVMQKLYLICFLLGTSITNVAQSFTVMTYNIRLDLKSDGANSWDNRKDFFTAQLRFYEPDLFGIQEALPNQVEDICMALPAYGHIGLGRDGKNRGEASSIFYKKNRFAIEDSGTFWLSETPGQVSKGWDASYNRVCTYALFKDIKNGHECWMFNTHLDNIGEIARTKGLELILSRIRLANTRKLPVILTGDFNSEPGTPVIQLLKKQMIDSREVSVEKPFGPEGSFNEFKYDKTVTRLIDYIFISKNCHWEVSKYAILSDARDHHYPSDHFPVFVKLKYSRKLQTESKRH